jgi:hypothetical protein
MIKLILQSFISPYFMRLWFLPSIWPTLERNILHWPFFYPRSLFEFICSYFWCIKTRRWQTEFYENEFNEVENYFCLFLLHQKSYWLLSFAECPRVRMCNVSMLSWKLTKNIRFSLGNSHSFFLFLPGAEKNCVGYECLKNWFALKVGNWKFMINHGKNNWVLVNVLFFHLRN